MGWELGGGPRGSEMTEKVKRKFEALEEKKKPPNLVTQVVGIADLEHRGLVSLLQVIP